MYLCVGVYMSAMPMEAKVIDPLELELQGIGSHLLRVLDTKDLLY